MTLARQERHKAGRYPIVNTGRRPEPTRCTCEAQDERPGPHHSHGAEPLVPRCPLFQLPGCRRPFTPATVDPYSVVLEDVPHLRDDAPARQCSLCGRRSVSAERWESCDMLQPSGERCHGVFQ